MPSSFVGQQQQEALLLELAKVQTLLHPVGAQQLLTVVRGPHQQDDCRRHHPHRHPHRQTASQRLNGFKKIRHDSLTLM
jgi:hypothetical protein